MPRNVFRIKFNTRKVTYLNEYGNYGNPILGLLLSLPVWKRHFRTTSGRKPPSSVDVLKLRLPHPGHNQSGSNYSLNLANNNCTGSRINTEIVAKKWRKNMVLTHVAFDARGRGLGIFFAINPYIFGKSKQKQIKCRVEMRCSRKNRGKKWA